MADEQNIRWCIYSLLDPRDFAIRYIGKSKEPDTRFAFHVANARRCTRRGGRHTRVSAWIISLLNAKTLPVFSMLVDDIEAEGIANEIETALIANCRASGYELTNLADGGEGTTGSRRTPEQRKRMAAAMKGVPKTLTQEQRDAISIRNTTLFTGMKRPGQSERSHGIATAQWAARTPEQRQAFADKIRATKPARYPPKPPKPPGPGSGNYKKSPEHIRKMAEGHRGITAGAVAKWSKPGERERMSALMSKTMKSLSPETISRRTANALATKARNRARQAAVQVN